MDYTSLTLGELLSSQNETIKRNAVSILKVLQKRIKGYSYLFCKDCHNHWSEIERNAEDWSDVFQCPLCGSRNIDEE